jgi:hypothetical protein
MTPQARGRIVEPVGARYFPGIQCGVGALDSPERLIVGSVRLWLRAPSDWPVIADNFRLAFGDNESLFALNGLKGLLETLAKSARRTLYFHQPCCGQVSADERSLLALVAALQHGCHEHAQAILRWLLPAPSQAEAYKHVFWLACGMADCGLMLKPPGGGPGSC